MKILKGNSIWNAESLKRSGYDLDRRIGWWRSVVVRIFGLYSSTVNCNLFLIRNRKHMIIIESPTIGMWRYPGNEGMSWLPFAPQSKLAVESKGTFATNFQRNLRRTMYTSRSYNWAWTRLSYIVHIKNYTTTNRLKCIPKNAPTTVSLSVGHLIQNASPNPTETNKPF